MRRGRQQGMRRHVKEVYLERDVGGLKVVGGRM